MTRITEQPSSHRHLETKSIEEITAAINGEDKLGCTCDRKSFATI